MEPLGKKDFDDLVRSVSRSFSLTLLAIPKPKRRSVALTYLLARYADTIADSGSWDHATRLTYLSQWENAIIKKNLDWEMSDSVGSFSESEAAFLLKGKTLLSEFWGADFVKREPAREVLKTLISAMKWDLKTFGAQDSSKELTWGIRDASFFDWYCFSIAGCVGTYWTKVFEQPPSLDPLGVAYGKGLQRINILRDVPEDWARGRVYLPESDIQDRGFDRMQPLWQQPGWQDYVHDYIEATRKLLLHGAQYCDSLSYFDFRLKWASKMPLLIGLQTLERLQSAAWEERIKISRTEVKALAKQAFWQNLWNQKLSKAMMSS